MKIKQCPAYMRWSKLYKLLHNSWLNVLNMSQQKTSPVQLLQQSRICYVLFEARYCVKAKNRYKPEHSRLDHRGCCRRCRPQQRNNRGSLQTYVDGLNVDAGVLPATNACDSYSARAKMLCAKRRYACCCTYIAAHDQVPSGLKGGYA